MSNPIIVSIISILLNAMLALIIFIGKGKEKIINNKLDMITSIIGEFKVEIKDCIGKLSDTVDTNENKNTNTHKDIYELIRNTQSEVAKLQERIDGTKEYMMDWVKKQT